MKTFKPIINVLDRQYFIQQKRRPQQKLSNFFGRSSNINLTIVPHRKPPSQLQAAHPCQSVFQMTKKFLHTVLQRKVTIKTPCSRLAAYQSRQLVSQPQSQSSGESSASITKSSHFFLDRLWKYWKHCQPSISWERLQSECL